MSNRVEERPVRINHRNLATLLVELLTLEEEEIDIRPAAALLAHG